MQTETWLSRDDVSRRRLFKGAGVTFIGGSAVFLAACGGDNTGGTAAGGGVGAEESSQGQPSDADLLNSALDLEHMAVAAYAQALDILTGRAQVVGRQFRDQEQEHADALTAAVKSRGGSPSKPRSSYEFGDLRTQEDVLKFAVDLENTAVAAYIDVLPRLGTGQLRATAASILSNEAAHIAVLRSALGVEPAPDAFVVGKKEAGA